VTTSLFRVITSAEALLSNSVYIVNDTDWQFDVTHCIGDSGGEYKI
jgi:hypothetical protein